MTGFLVLLVVSCLLLIYLITESILYNRQLNRIPIRITVSGTRGKTSIVRTLASVLRTHGLSVLAKTTGSEAMYILPDGLHEKIRRRGQTSILEQKRLVAKAARLKAHCILTEIMSINPENHATETQKLIKPAITVFSNFRADHTDVVAMSVQEITELFVNDIFPKSKVIVPESELNEFIFKGISQNQSRLITAETQISRQLNLPDSVYQKHFPSNLDTVVTVARYMGIPDGTIFKGIIDTRLDIGQLEIFPFHTPNRKIWFVNAFAANDPVSTLEIIEKTRQILAKEINTETATIGLLALRSDRGERSRQWLDYLQSAGKNPFSKIYISGIHSPVFVRKLKNCERLTTHNPAEITRHIMANPKPDLLVFGIVNIHGLGVELITHWKTNSLLTN